MVSVVQNIPQQLKTTQDNQQVITDWLNKLAKSRDAAEIDLLKKATDLVEKDYQQTHFDSDQKLFIYSLSIADILEQLKMDTESLVAAILQYTSLNQKQLKAEFGDNIAKLVEELKAIKHLTASSVNIDGIDSKADHIENFRRMLLTISEDVRVILILLSERIQQMRRLKSQPLSIQKQVAQETHDIYAPLANRLGIWQIKWELEDLSLRYMNPAAYKDIASALQAKRDERKSFIQTFIDRLQDYLTPLNIQAQISGRPKHIYSIWKKMQRKGLGFEQIFDVLAVRVMVDSIKECYEVLGTIHSHWKHIPDEFDDYIANPKGNNYQSLHTVVIGVKQQPVEIQIRTVEMHDHAERGIAAHWRYKENNEQNNEALERRIEWMRNWLELKEAAEEDNFAEHFSDEFAANKIYVLTPQGKVIELHKGATVLDFAYSIHTSIGHRCIGAKINGKIVRLNKTLKNGQTIEILTTKKEQPKQDWLSPHLGYTTTSRARSCIRSWFKQQDYSFHLDEGKAAIEREMKRIGADKPDLKNLIEKYHCKTVDELLVAVGSGRISPIKLVQSGLTKKTNAPFSLDSFSKPASKPAKGEVIIAGADNLLTQIAKCCLPIPHDKIIGYITRGRGITIHRKNCANLKHLSEQEQERLIQAEWNSQIQTSYQIDIQIYALDRRGLLKDISSILLKEDINVLATKTYADLKTEHASLFFSLEIFQIEQFSRLMDKIQQLPDIIEAKRVH